MGGLRKYFEGRLGTVAVGGVDGVSARMVVSRMTRLSEIHSKVVAVLVSKAASFQTLIPCYRYLLKQFCPVVTPFSPYNIEMPDNPRTAPSKPSDLGVCGQPTVQTVYRRLITLPRKLPVHPRCTKFFPRELGEFLSGKAPILFPRRLPFLHANDED